MTTVSPSDTSLEQLSTAQLVSRALDDMKQLARVELDLAKQDLRSELKAMKRAGIEFGIAFVLAILGLSSLIMAIVLAANSALLALIIGIALLAIAGVLGATGYSAVPKKPLEPTRQRVTEDIEQLKEHVA